MKLYNRGARSFIVHKDDAIRGCSPLEHDINKDRVYFNPGTEAELRDEIGEKLLKNYSTELMQVDKNRIKGVDEPKRKSKKLAKAQK